MNLSRISGGVFNFIRGGGATGPNKTSYAKIPLIQSRLRDWPDDARQPPFAKLPTGRC
jgi:hypothetical protein